MLKKIIIFSTVVVFLIALGLALFPNDIENAVKTSPSITDTSLSDNEPTSDETSIKSEITANNPDTIHATENKVVESKIRCGGNARCITGIVTEIIDGDTIQVNGTSIRFALSSAPELKESNGPEARDYIESICPANSTVTIDEDDDQTQESYGRIIAKINCNGVILNEELLKSKLGTISTNFCSISEFSGESWAQKYGCNTNHEPESQISDTTSNTNQCDPSYPDVCIKSFPPDLDCNEISERNFKVLPPDPHKFDMDKDGIGCQN